MPVPYNRTTNHSPAHRHQRGREGRILLHLCHPLGQLLPMGDGIVHHQQTRGQQALDPGHQAW